MLYGTLFCSYQEFAERCCHCGGGTYLTVSTTSGPCVDIALTSVWGSGVDWTCAALSGLDDATHCANEVIAETCCHCSAASAASVEVSVAMVSTDEGKEDICSEESRATGGATYRSVDAAFETAEQWPNGASLTVSCSSRRLTNSRIRSLQTDFVLVSSASFTDAEDATAFSASVTEASSDLASALESHIATTLGVDVIATVQNVEVTVASDDSASSGHQHRGINVLVWTLALVAAVAFLNID